MSQPPTQQPRQQQSHPGRTEPMHPQPRDEMADYQGSGLLAGKRALVTGGDSGIGRAVAVAFAKEGADVAIAYLSDQEDPDAKHTQGLVEATGRRCLLLRGDLAEERHCRDVVEASVNELGGLDVLVSHAGTQATSAGLTEVSTQQWDRTFKVNVYGAFWVTKAALEHLPRGGAIILTSSVNGLRGNKNMIDYAATKGALLSFTYSLAQSLTEHGIRVNCVAPGPVWTPLIPSTFPPEKVESFGQQVPMQRWAHPDEIAPSYVFFAANRLSGYYTGEVLAPVGGETMPG